MTRSITITLAVFVLAITAQAATIHVYSGQSIQTAINGAGGGDEIIVHPGTYVEHIDLLGKAITVRSSDGPEVTIIDGDADGSVIACESGEDANTVIEGFTITNGSDGEGGGMYNLNSSPTLTNCTFRGNSARYEGGGMYNLNSSPTLNHCTFSDNTTGVGGGMFNWRQSSPTLTNCVFSSNSASTAGGMCNYENCSPILTNCTFSDNAAAAAGGGMFNWRQSSPTLTKCILSGNSACFGGGIYNTDHSNPTVINCAFIGNSADSSGGGMENFNYSSPTLTNCTFNANSADVNGGGMYNDLMSEPTLINCTLSGNSAGVYGGGIGSYGNGATLANCIVWGNAAETAPEISDRSGGTTTATYSCILGGWPGTGNIDADPLFVDPDGPDDDPNAWEDNDYRLSAGSPCIGAGDPAFVPAPPGTDLNGHYRVLCGRVDMGAYEFGIGDHDCDQDVDLDDFDSWITCMTGPDGGAYDPGCESSDFEFDGDVDMHDFSLFQQQFTGPQP